MSTYIHLSIEQLRAAGAWREGIELFERIASLCGKRNKIRVEWGPLSWLWLENTCPGFVGWLYRAGLVPMPSFRGAGLRGANLRGADLHGADLEGASLVGATMPIGGAS